MSNHESTTDRFLKSLKDNKFLAAILVFAFIVIGIGSVTDSLDKIINFGHKYFSPSPQKQESKLRLDTKRQTKTLPEKVKGTTSGDQTLSRGMREEVLDSGRLADSTSQSPALPPSVPRSPLLPGYVDVEVYKIASAAFRNELANKMVRVVADQFVMASHISLPPDLASRVVPFWIYRFSNSTAYATALVPKTMIEEVLEQHKGQAISLYGKLVAGESGLFLVVQKVE